MRKGSAQLPREYRKIVEDLYNEHKKLMLCVAMKVVNNEDHATDIVHSSFIRIVKHIKKIETLSPKETKGYIAYIVKNLSLDFVNNNENKKVVLIESFDEFFACDTSLAEKNAVINLDIDDVMATLELLDSKYSLPVFHKYVLGYSMSEIAKMLNITVPNAKVRCHRGRLMLINLMEEGSSHE